MWVDWPHHPCRLGGPPQRSKIKEGPHVGGLATSILPFGESRSMGQNQKWLTCGWIGYMTLPFGDSPTRGQTRKWPTCGRIGYITPAIWGVPIKGTKSEVTTSGLHHPAVWGVTNKLAKSEREHTWADWLHHPCRLWGPPQGDEIGKGPHVSRLGTSEIRNQNQKEPTFGRIDYITPSV